MGAAIPQPLGIPLSSEWSQAWAASEDAMGHIPICGPARRYQKERQRGAVAGSWWEVRSWARCPWLHGTEGSTDKK